MLHWMLTFSTWGFLCEHMRIGWVAPPPFPDLWWSSYFPLLLGWVLPSLISFCHLPLYKVPKGRGLAPDACMDWVMGAEVEWVPGVSIHLLKYLFASVVCGDVVNPGRDISCEVVVGGWFFLHILCCELYFSVEFSELLIICRKGWSMARCIYISYPNKVTICAIYISILH